MVSFPHGCFFDGINLASFPAVRMWEVQNLSTRLMTSASKEIVYKLSCCEESSRVHTFLLVVACDWIFCWQLTRCDVMRCDKLIIRYVKKKLKMWCDILLLCYAMLKRSYDVMWFNVILSYCCAWKEVMMWCAMRYDVMWYRYDMIWYCAIKMLKIKLWCGAIDVTWWVVIWWLCYALLKRSYDVMWYCANVLYAGKKLWYDDCDVPSSFPGSRAFLTCFLLGLSFDFVLGFFQVYFWSRPRFSLNSIWFPSGFISVFFWFSFKLSSDSLVSIYINYIH